MALVLLNATTFVAGYDFTADTNKVQFDSTVADLDTTTFATTGWKSRTGGLKDATIHEDGLWSSSPDSEAFTGLGVVDQPVTVSPTGVAASIAYMLRTEKMKYQAFGQIGALTPFALDLSASNSQGIVRGQLAAAKGNVSATGPLGSGLNLGAVGSTQFLYATFHVFGTPGTTVTVQVQSDTSNAFAAPTVRGTIGPLTTSGGVWMTRVAGAITDTWWRFNVSAITGTFTVAGAIGIQ